MVNVQSGKKKEEQSVKLIIASAELQRLSRGLLGVVLR